MKLDLRDPTIVVAGAFNPAIFNLGWMAAELYGFAEGEPVNVTMVTDVAQQTHRPYIQSISVLVEPMRLSIFVDDFSDETLGRAETIAAKAGQLLPHTPVAGYGLNFKFLIEHPDAALVDKLKPVDGIDAIGPVSQSEITSHVQLNDHVRLNFSRTIVDDNLIATFNFHRNLGRFNEVEGTVMGAINNYCAQARNIMGQLYGDNEIEETQRALNIEVGGNG